MASTEPPMLKLNDANPPRSLSLRLLENVHIAAPCPASWDGMLGDDITRHCSECQLNVYNLSAMTRDESEAFLRERFADEGGRVCVRFFRRADGTILSRDCPRGLAAARRRVGLLVAKVAAAFGVACAVGLGAEQASRPSLRSSPPFPQMMDWVWWTSAKLGLRMRVPPPPPPPIMGRMLMGAGAMLPRSVAPLGFDPKHPDGAVDPPQDQMPRPGVQT